jgi:hypothetical protein
LPGTGLLLLHRPPAPLFIIIFSEPSNPIKIPHFSLKNIKQLPGEEKSVTLSAKHFFRTKTGNRANGGRKDSITAADRADARSRRNKGFRRIAQSPAFKPHSRGR